MEFGEGYRLRVATLGELTKLLGSYRGVSLRVMGAVYSEQVAKAAVTSLDLAAIGLAAKHPDIIERASESVRGLYSKTENGVFAPLLNSRIDFYFIGNAILASMVHGQARHAKSWESRREVIRWGWSDEAAKPGQVSQTAWDDRRKYWTEASKLKASGMGVFRYELLEDTIPTIGWGAIQRFLPAYEWRREQCVRRLAQAEKLDAKALGDRDRARLTERVERFLIREIDRNSFSAQLAMNRPRQDERKARTVAALGKGRSNDTSIIDHADIVVSSDGRPFIAVAHVQFRAEDRVFIQVGSKDITFSQNGIQFGSVPNVSATARDYLRGLTSITLVEVSENQGKRLIRAKHTAMVTDISLSEGMRRPVHTFKRRPRSAAIGDI
jgi:hypothetical protein